MPPMVAHSSPAHGETFIGAGLDTWSGSPFVQTRLALLGKTVFLLSFGFFAVINCVMVVVAGIGVSLAVHLDSEAQRVVHPRSDARRDTARA